MKDKTLLELYALPPFFMAFINLMLPRTELNLLYIFFLLNLADANDEFSIFLGLMTAVIVKKNPFPRSLAGSFSLFSSNS
jgi:hypothetical protein